MLKPWKKTKEERYNAGYRRLIKKTFVMPNGQEEVFDIIDGGPVSCVLALTPDNKVVLAKQFRPSVEDFLYELPGGEIDSEETPEQAAARELLEETGYVGELQFVGKNLVYPYMVSDRNNFIALNCKKVQEATHFGTEQTESVEMSLEDFRKILKTGQISDVANAYLCLDYLKLL